MAEIEVSVEMVDKCVDCMKKGKAAEIDGLTVLTVEHLMYSHPALVEMYETDHSLAWKLEKMKTNYPAIS